MKYNMYFSLLQNVFTYESNFEDFFCLAIMSLKLNNYTLPNIFYIQRKENSLVYVGTKSYRVSSNSN